MTEPATKKERRNSLRDRTRRGTPNRNSLVAMADMERLGINPIEMLLECFQEAMKSYKAGRGVSEKGDPGAQYLAVATKAATELAQFKHPKLSAIAIKDLTENETKTPLTTAEAIEVMKADPFAPKEIKNIPTDRIIDAMKSTIRNPLLPGGDD